MSTYPFSIPSGVNLVPEVSGTSFLGTASNPFGIIFASSISGTQLTSATNALYTGLLSGGVVTIASPSGINIEAGTGRVVDNHTDPSNPTLVNLSWPAASGVPLTYLASAVRTYVGIDISGNIYQKPTTNFTPSDLRHYIELARVIHPNASGQGIVTNTAPAFDSFLNAIDFINVIGPLNINGNVYSASGASLKIQKSQGSTYYPGINFHNDRSNPNQTTDPVIAPVTIQYRYRGLSGTFVTVSSVATINPGNYDDGTGTLNTVGNNEYTNQRIYYSFGSNRTIVLYGQTKYNGQSNALSALTSEIFSPDPDLANVTSFRGWLTVKGNASDLSQTTEAVFTNAGVFGLQSPATVTTATTDLQTAYNNSTTPEILTDATRDGLTMKEGTNVGANLYEGLNQFGASVFSVSASGNVTISGTTTTHDIIPHASGESNLGSTTKYYGTIFANALSGVTINTAWAGGTVTSNVTPDVSGNLSMGSAALPFGAIYTNQFATSLVSQTITATSGNINWNNGTSQVLDFTGGISGSCTLYFANPIPGSAYVLKTIQNASGTTALIWPTIKWQGGVSGTMTAASGVSDLFNFWYDGTNYLGSYSNNYF